MPAKKAAKAAKKVAKKAAKKAAKHTPARDLRRAYEHLGRIEVLDLLAEDKLDDISTTVGAAQAELAAGNAGNGAELLRAAEHLAFASLALRDSPARLSPELERAVTEEFEHLLRRAEANGPGKRRIERNSKATGRDPLMRLVPATIAQARAAFKERAFRRALELARAAEALTHVEPTPARLPGGQGRTADRLAS